MSAEEEGNVKGELQLEFLREKNNFIFFIFPFRFCPYGLVFTKTE